MSRSPDPASRDAHARAGFSKQERGLEHSPRVARPLLGQWLVRAAILGVGAVIGSGCLLGQDDVVLEDIVLPNHPPRINGQSAEPQKVSTIGLDGCRIVFQIPVEDPDVDDLVQARWYIDFDPKNTQTNRPVDEFSLENNGQAARPLVTKTFTNGPFAELAATGPHVVTLMVFDGTLGVFEGPNSVPKPRPIPGSDAGNPTYSDAYDWFVTTDPSLPCD